MWEGRNMNKYVRVVGVLLVVLSVFAMAGTPASPEIGAKAPEFTLKDTNGKSHSLNEHFTSKYVALIFVSTRCPVSNAYNERMAKLANDYTSKGVTFLGINANVKEDVEEIKEHASKNGFKFALLKDVDNVVADLYSATVTPEVFVLDNKGILRYHGRIDDSKDADDVSSHDLRATLDALLSGKDVSRAETKAFGCSIKRAKKQG